ncbi:Aurofusarin cluster transcription factor aurR2 [Fulvia fulva]|uniref:Aurofusarin cluster transcription factor aurR2 n=1 Tax=Passalora fulva TaxID=5499 RepID=A0A9Q8URM8_PASFU|nr:Aurofusarin cluster transcription factor aurR2 [Fulvia fulva]KAK4620892.1 Aurofusarin cluster transcription factor aurR2 [Fulvia fulva]UJO19913.1 Aurofusarin cluster transcription factor aurR2 [Fulvia fulva]
MEAQPQKRDNHTPSCAVCQRRKVKCDRVYPCAACTKSGLECAFPPPRNGKRARRSTTHQHGPQMQEPAARPPYSSAPHVDRATAGYSGGMRHGSNELPSPESTISTGTNNARLVSDGAGYRYVNNHLWSALSTDGHADGRSPGASTEDHKSSGAGSRSGHAIYEDIARGGDEGSEGRSFLFGNASSDSRSVAEQPVPPANHVVFLWQTFLANVDPVMKISHAPTIQPILLGQIGRPNIPANEKVLVSAIYFISTVSLTDEQCVGSLQDTRANLLKRNRIATEAALSAAGFITTTDTMVLQALILYLAALRSLGEVQTVWSLFGLAIRIAGTIGLARDGTSFNLSPFETEMRRRLWWGIVYFDGRMAELVGQDGDLMGNDYEAAQPSNLNDNDLFPTMSRFPEPRKGPSDAIYLQARILSVTVARRLQGLAGPQGTWHKLREATMSTREKLDIMHHIEQRYNAEILEICDPSVPLQYLSINTARTFATKLRLIARIPIVDLDRDWEDPTGFSENAFLLSMDLLQLQVDLWCEPMVAQWRWHWQAHFQWYALVSLLRQTRLRQTGHGISRAWMLIQKAFEIIIPTLELGERKSLLLSGIHNLLDAAKRQQDQADSAAHDRKPPAQRNTPVMVQQPGPAMPPNGFSAGYGARPHTAVLPSMEQVRSQAQTPVSFGVSATALEQADPIFGLDLDAIDWVEFDRLATELCQQ